MEGGQLLALRKGEKNVLIGTVCVNVGKKRLYRTAILKKEYQSRADALKKKTQAVKHMDSQEQQSIKHGWDLKKDVTTQKTKAIKITVDEE